LHLRRAIFTALLYCLLLGGCAESEGDEVGGYVVRAQDTLYSIAWRHNLDFRDLARWNNIGPDFRISIGQVLSLRPAQLAPKTLRAPTPNAARPAASNARRPAPAAPRAPLNTLQKWAWPTDRGVQPLAVSGGGILIPGVMGQDVRAASGGRVVYTGSGIRGYGNLIIIKHDNSLLSAYAHNREMLVRDGQDVTGGQVIAHMGDDAHHMPALYFEIRQNGRPIDPLPLISGVK